MKFFEQIEITCYRLGILHCETCFQRQYPTIKESSKDFCENARSNGTIHNKIIRKKLGIETELKLEYLYLYILLILVVSNLLNVITYLV